MKRLWIPVFFATVFLAQALQGVVPQKWVIRTKDDFLKGKLNGISVSYGGVLSLSPKQEEINGPTEEFYLSLLVTREDVAYLGTGHSGKIFRMSKNAAPELYFQVPEMDIYCLAQDARGNLYAATSPNGKIYKITGKNDGKVFFNPREKYIWDMMFIKGDVLLAAVGENGGIYEITQQGEGRLILKVEENHILCLTKDSNGDILAGSGGKGLLYRMPKRKKASVLFESPFEEIRDIALDDKGNIFVAASGAVIRPRMEDTPVSVRGESEVTVAGAPSSLGPGDALTSVKNQPGALSVFLGGEEGLEDPVQRLLWHAVAAVAALHGAANTRHTQYSVHAEKDLLFIVHQQYRVFRALVMQIHIVHHSLPPLVFKTASTVRCYSLRRSGLTPQSPGI